MFHFLLTEMGHVVEEGPLNAKSISLIVIRQ